MIPTWPRPSAEKPSDYAHARRKQISSLRTAFPTILETSTDSVYDLRLPFASTTAPSTLHLRISLAPSFPETPPTVTLFNPTNAPVAHPWLNSALQVVGHEKLKNWNTGGGGTTGLPNLGTIVVEVVDEFRKRPPWRTESGGGAGDGYGGYDYNYRPRTGPVPPPLPPPPPQGYTSSRSSSITSSSPTHISSSTSPGQKQQSPLLRPYPRSLPQPPQSHLYGGASAISQQSSAALGENFSGLRDLSEEELKYLLSDVDALNLFFEDQEQVRNMLTVQKELQTGNEDLARKNMAKKPEIEQLKQSIEELKKRASVLKSELEQKFAEHGRYMKRFTADHITARLQTSLSELDAQSERHAQDMLGGKLEVSEFLTKFRESRKAYHLCAARVERVKRDPGVLLMQGGSGGAGRK